MVIGRARFAGHVSMVRSSYKSYSTQSNKPLEMCKRKRWTVENLNRLGTPLQDAMLDSARSGSCKGSCKMSERQVFNAAIFRRGQKKELFDDKQDDVEWDEQAELREKLADLQALWAMPRAGRDLAAAIWRPELGVAELVLHKGKLFSHMGYTQGSKTYLHIEEAVYMVDRVNLLLFLEAGGPRRQQRLLSLQEAYDLLVGSGLRTEQYLVYAKLMRAGYIVQRHPARWSLKLSEDPRQIWSRWYPQQQLQQPQQQGAGGPLEAGGTLATTAAAAPAAQQTGTQAGPAASNKLPAGGSGRKKRKLEEVQQHARWWAAGPTSLPWLAGLPGDFLGGLPRCEVEADSRSGWAVQYPAMAPLHTLPDTQLSEERNAGEELLDYDVYEPNSKFSRKAAGAPSFRVAVLPRERPSADPPFVVLEAVAAAERASPGIPVKLAVVETGDIAFYGLGQAELTSIL